MYTNSKNQISLEEAYRMVHLEKKESCCDSCSKGEECDCEENDCDCKECKNKVEESFDAPSGVDDALDAGQEIVLRGDDAGSELKKFLPLIFSGAAVSLGIDEQSASEIAKNLMSRLNISEVESRISDLHSEKEKLTSQAKNNMEAQVKLNKVIDKFLKHGTLEALDVLYHNPENRIPPSGIIKALEAEIEKRIAARR